MRPVLQLIHAPGSLRPSCPVTPRFLGARALACGLLLCTVVPAQTVGPNRNLTRAPGNQYETAVAIDPAGNRVFVACRNEAGGLYTARSADAGATWTGGLTGRASVPAPGDIPRAYGNASVAWDSFGNLFLAYLAQSSAGAPTYVALSLSRDGGATFYSPVGPGPALLLPIDAPGTPVIGDQPTVAVGPGSAGSPASVWVSYWTQGGIMVSGAAVSGLGAVGPFTSFRPSQPAAVNYGDIAVGPNGEVLITYGPNGGSGSTLYVNLKSDGLGNQPFSPASAVVPVNIGGFTPIPAQPNWGIDPEAGLAWDRGTGRYRGRVYLVYTDTLTAGSADTDTFVLHSDDLGVTWSRPVRVNDDAGTNSQFLPHISLDQSSGTVAVTWYDARDSAHNDAVRYYGAFSTDGGATFAPNFPISAGASNQAASHPLLRKADYGDYTGNAFVNGLLIAAWADNSNSTGDNPDGATNFDVYTTVVLPPAPATLVSVSAASFTGEALAPDSIAAAFGRSLSTGTEPALSQPLPTILANSAVTVKDSAGTTRPAALFYVSPAQINFLVPEDTADGPASVTVMSGTQVAAAGSIQVATVAPGLFTANRDGTGPPAGQAIAIATDLTQTVQQVANCGAVLGSCVAAPIDLGPPGTQVVLVLYGTGIRGRSSLAAVGATAGGIDAQVQYAGPQPQFAGLDQVNILLPQELAGRGGLDLRLTVEGKPANLVRINIR